VSTLKHVFSTVINNKDAGKITPKKNKDSGEKLVDTPAGVECDHSPKDQSASLPQLPPFLPLLHTETQEACMLLCLQLLGLKTKKGVIDQAHLKRVCPPPIILNGKSFQTVRDLHSMSIFHPIRSPLSILQSSFVAVGATPSFSSSFIPVLAKGGS
jgi:hypothetical protein